MTSNGVPPPLPPPPPPPPEAAPLPPPPPAEPVNVDPEFVETLNASTNALEAARCLEVEREASLLLASSLLIHCPGPILAVIGTARPNLDPYTPDSQPMGQVYLRLDFAFEMHPVFPNTVDHLQFA
jgi:hypothetical protein